MYSTFIQSVWVSLWSALLQSHCAATPDLMWDQWCWASRFTAYPESIAQGLFEVNLESFFYFPSCVRTSLRQISWFLRPRHRRQTVCAAVQTGERTWFSRGLHRGLPRPTENRLLEGHSEKHHHYLGSSSSNFKNQNMTMKLQSWPHSCCHGNTTHPILSLRGLQSSGKSGDSFAKCTATWTTARTPWNWSRQ